MTAIRLPPTIDVPTYRRLPTEAAMTEAIGQLVTLRGGKLWHLRDARQAPELEDLPDLLVIVPGCAAMVELKSIRRTVTPGQRQVAELLATVERFVGGIVRPIPRVNEMAYDELLEELKA